MLTGVTAAGEPVVHSQALQKVWQAFELLVTQCEINVVVCQYYKGELMVFSVGKHHTFVLLEVWLGPMHTLPNRDSAATGSALRSQLGI